MMNKINYITRILNSNNRDIVLYNKEFIINNYLLFKNIIGVKWLFRGKNSNLDSNARSLKYLNTNGKFYLLYLERSAHLNYYSSNLSNSNSYIINKNGKYSISTTLNHF